MARKVVPAVERAICPVIFHVPFSVRTAVEQIAARDGKSISAVGRAALSEYVERAKPVKVER